MQGKRDQLQAHLFVVGRLTSALVRADPDQPERPMRRTIGGGLVGAVLSTVLLAGFGVYGLTGRGSSNNWRSDNTIIVEKETGTRYVYLDGTLRPTLNYASARLAAGGQQASVRTVAGKSLAGVPHGRPIGIVGAPDSLPKPAGLRSDPWLSCAVSLDRAGQDAIPGLAIALGPRFPAQDQPAGRGALIADETGTAYLITQGQRLRLPTSTTAAALGYASTAPMRVASAWLNGFSVGPDLAAPAVPNRGQNGPNVEGRPTRIGQVLESSIAGGATEYHLVLGDGLLQIGQTVARLLLADPGTVAAYSPQPVRPIEISAAGAVSTPQSKSTAKVAGFPPVPPTLIDAADDTTTLCVRLSFDAEHGLTPTLATASTGQVRSTAVAVAGTTPGNAGTAGSTSTGADTSRSRAADRIAIEPGTGALVVGQASAGVPTGTVYLITDLGVKYPLPNDDVVAALGYAGRARTPVPTTVLELLPTGPALDPAAARSEA